MKIHSLNSLLPRLTSHISYLISYIFLALPVASPATEVTVFFNAAADLTGKTLVIAEYVPGDSRAKPRKWSFTIADPTVRNVYSLPIATNDVIEAWADLDSDGAFDVTEPYGTNATRDYPEIEVSDKALAIDLANDTSRAGDTRANVFDDFAEIDTDATPSLIATYLSRYTNSCHFTTATFNPKARQRVRVVRYLANFIVAGSCGVDYRVIFDATVEPGARSVLTEADFARYDGNAFDLEWSYLRSEIIDNSSVRAATGQQIEKMAYMIVIGNGPAGWVDSSSITNIVHALNTTVVRRFNSLRVLPTNAKVGTWSGASSTSSRPTFQWTDPGYNTAYRLVVTNSEATVYDSGTFRAPARDPSGIMRHKCPTSFSLGTYGWKISPYCAKFISDSFTTNCPPFTVTD